MGYPLNDPQEDDLLSRMAQSEYGQISKDPGDPMLPGPDPEVQKDAATAQQDKAVAQSDADKANELHADWKKPMAMLLGQRRGESALPFAADQVSTILNTGKGMLPGPGADVAKNGADTGGGRYSAQPGDPTGSPQDYLDQNPQAAPGGPTPVQGAPDKASSAVNWGTASVKRGPLPGASQDTLDARDGVGRSLQSREGNILANVDEQRAMADKQANYAQHAEDEAIHRQNAFDASMKEQSDQISDARKHLSEQRTDPNAYWNNHFAGPVGGRIIAGIGVAAQGFANGWNKIGGNAALDSIKADIKGAVDAQERDYDKGLTRIKGMENDYSRLRGMGLDSAKARAEITSSHREAVMDQMKAVAAQGAGSERAGALQTGLEEFQLENSKQDDALRNQNILKAEKDAELAVARHNATAAQYRASQDRQAERQFKLVEGGIQHKYRLEEQDHAAGLKSGGPGAPPKLTKAQQKQADGANAAEDMGAKGEAMIKAVNGNPLARVPGLGSIGSNANQDVDAYNAEMLAVVHDRSKGLRSAHLIEETTAPFKIGINDSEEKKRHKIRLLKEFIAGHQVSDEPAPSD